MTHEKEAEASDAPIGVLQVVYQEPTTTTTTKATTTMAATATTKATTTTTTSTETIIVDIHQQDAHVQAPVYEQELTHSKESGQTSLQIYEASFPDKLETPKASTTFEIFSDPNRFSLDSVHRRTHYLTDSLEGTLWLDADSNGVRGSASDSTLNALEYDTGIGGVKVQLVKCETNELAQVGFSSPNQGLEKTSALKKSEVPEAGQYSFQKMIMDISNSTAGRYYVMYQAPENYRISGNVLPLERKVAGERSNDFECIPKGGEGDEYKVEVQEKGDLDWGGYCARTVGCLEVGNQLDLQDVYNDLRDVEDAKEQQNSVALPSKSMLNVGLSEELWPLRTNQYADAQITLNFASTVSSEALLSTTMSNVTMILETALAEIFQGGVSSFDIKGVDLNGAVYAQASVSSMLRGLQRTNMPAQVTYNITTLGSYKPPPFEQLGAIISDSINADPQEFVKSLKDREGSNLPPIFEEVEDLTARHLTTKVGKVLPPPISEIQESNEVGKEHMDSWAIIPVILMAFMILGLLGLLLFRRLHLRRVNKVYATNDVYRQQRLGFVVSDDHPEDGKKAKVYADTTPSSNDENSTSSSNDENLHPLSAHPESDYPPFQPEHAVTLATSHTASHSNSLASNASRSGHIQGSRSSKGSQSSSASSTDRRKKNARGQRMPSQWTQHRGERNQGRVQSTCSFD